MSNICNGVSKYRCPSCDWYDNCRFAYGKEINKDEEKKDEISKM